jgi:hypothetical protein
MKAGFVYFALVFALGFLLGTLRTQVARNPGERASAGGDY